MKGLRLFGVMLCALLVASACGQQPAAPTEGDVIVFAAAPLSGFQANGGQTVVGGVRLAAEEINRAGGLLGYRVVVEAMDDESDSEVAVEIANEIASRVRGGERVLGLIGHYNSGQTEAALEVYDTLPIVVITPTASLKTLTEQGYERFFRVNANDLVQAQVDARFLVEELEATSVAVLHNDEAYGIDLAAEIGRQLEALGVQVAMTRQIPIGPPDLTGEPGSGEPVYYPEAVREIAASGADAVFYAGYEVECPYLRYDMRQVGLEGLPFLASDGCFLSATIDESEGAAEGMYTSAFAPSPQAVGDPQWIAAYQAVERRNPDTYSINGYVAMQVLAEGVRQAGKLEADAVADAIRGLDFETLIGKVQYQDNGDLVDPAMYIFKVEKGEFQQISPL
jgi:branched-chain amino acid transport system substrate-binding protein